MFLPRRIDNRQILWSSLSLIAISLIVPGALGIKPPHWFDVSTQPEQTKNFIRNLSLPGNLYTAEKEPVESFVAAAEPSRLSKALDEAPDDEPVELSWPAVMGVFTVPANFQKKIPPTHLELSGTAQKQSFVNLILPLIVASNDELMQRREAVREAAYAKDRNLLEKWAILYRVESNNLDNFQLTERLLRRVDVIPVALALAQAAVESGWGTSRFALQGNALFGQWAWTESAGMRPLDASNDRAFVRSFGSLLESVRAYMHNLNTHPNYNRFRNARYQLNSQNQLAKASKLAAYLDSYAEIGVEYVHKLRAIISSNDFDKYSRAQLG